MNDQQTHLIRTVLSSHGDEKPGKIKFEALRTHSQVAKLRQATKLFGSWDGDFWRDGVVSDWDGDTCAAASGGWSGPVS